MRNTNKCSSARVQFSKKSILKIRGSVSKKDKSIFGRDVRAQCPRLHCRTVSRATIFISSGAQFRAKIIRLAATQQTENPVDLHKQLKIYVSS